MKAKTIALTISLVFVSVVMGFQNNPNMGAWKLNETKSAFAGKARNHTVVYEAVGDQIKVTVDGVDENGAASHNEWTGKFDGKDYPVTGDSDHDAVAIQRVTDHKIKLTIKKGGKVVAKETVTVSKDGQTTTLDYVDYGDGKEQKGSAVYDKQ